MTEPIVKSNSNLILVEKNIPLDKFEGYLYKDENNILKGMKEFIRESTGFDKNNFLLLYNKNSNNACIVYSKFDNISKKDIRSLLTGEYEYYITSYQLIKSYLFTLWALCYVEFMGVACIGWTDYSEDSDIDLSDLIVENDHYINTSYINKHSVDLYKNFNAIDKDTIVISYGSMFPAIHLLKVGFKNNYEAFSRLLINGILPARVDRFCKNNKDKDIFSMYLEGICGEFCFTLSDINDIPNKLNAFIATG